MHYYTHNIADYRKDTAHLSALEHGIYRQLMDWYYLDEQPIPKETQMVLRRLRLASELECEALQNVLSDFFELREDGYHQGRCDADIAKYHSKVERNRQAGKLGGRPMKTQVVFSENPEQSKPKAKKTLTNNSITNNLITKNQEELPMHASQISDDVSQGIEKTPARVARDARAARMTSPDRPESVSETTWASYLTHRKAKRAPVTATVIDELGKEASKAGLTLEEAIRYQLRRGWQGFEAAWWANEQRGGSASSRSERASSVLDTTRMNAQLAKERLFGGAPAEVDVTPNSVTEAP